MAVETWGNRSARNTRRLWTVAAFVGGTVALTSILANTLQPKPISPDDISNGTSGMSAKERVDFDYAGGLTSIRGISRARQTCLEDSAYDPISSTLAADRDTPLPAVEIDSDNIISVIPAAGKVLRLTGFDNKSGILQPADTKSAEILAGNGCDPTADPLFK